MDSTLLSRILYALIAASSALKSEHSSEHLKMYLKGFQHMDSSNKCLQIKVMERLSEYLGFHHCRRFSILPESSSYLPHHKLMVETIQATCERFLGHDNEDT
ncbi:hypothetical protein TNCV_1122541 [Trichonephila clavipes]|nr:hypothetical protein TNCV_1122541 [Trichonephila clavipes]